jgi:tight adherence protein C
MNINAVMAFADILFSSAVGIAGFFLAYGVAAWVVALRDPTVRGFESFTETRDGRPGILARAWVKLEPFGRSLLPVIGDERLRIEEQLYIAGIRRPNAAALFVLSKLALVTAVIVVSWLLWPASSESASTSLFIIPLVGITLALVGPNWWLSTMVKRRQARLRNGFPDALDLLVICVEAGLGLTAAIERVTTEVRMLHPELAQEFAAVNAEIRSGIDRATALQGLNRRTGLPEIRGLVTLLVQTMQLGTGIADSLRVYSSEFRDQRMRVAEERAAKTGTKMIFPLVFCEFPAFFLVAVGPAVIQIYKNFQI